MTSRSDAGPARAAAAPLAHMVFFTLANRSEEDAQKLVDACQKYLSGHEGTVYFSVGTRAEELDRDVNVTDFDVALHLVFDSKAAHDTYQEHPRHLEFIEKNRSLWSGVRVFDSYLAGPSSGATR
ncbi:Dabb family protein [Tautonia sociabilis]|uniref:Dabb family protein n=2 Tax=Tautonia sociabilis TaxID=2080755 RepID=A0A432MH59_9BACT|nr:Dabb family protein [Tautonia sociabilis]